MQTASGLQSQVSFFFFFWGGGGWEFTREMFRSRVCRSLFTGENLLPKIGDHFQSVNNMAKNNLLPPLLFNKGKYRLEGISKSHPGQNFSVMSGLS